MIRGMNERPLASLATSLVVFTGLILTISSTTYAQIRVTIPSFPSCSNPQGQTIASYQTGVHGIPGDLATYTGSDTVYQLSEDTLTQCFCAENADGIQTNWWKISSLSLEEIEFLQAQGWVYIPNGADWGLQEAPYLAQNTKFDCDPGDDGDDGDNDDHDDNDDDDDNDNRIGSILGISTGDVLGLATTGNIATTALLVSVGALSLGVGIYLLKKSNENKETA